jgi:hypothetical protein
MATKQQVACFFLLAGVVGGAFVVTGLHFANQSTLPTLVGGSRLLATIGFPVCGAAIAAAVSLRFDPNGIGWMQGIQIALLSFLVVALIYGIVALVALIVSGRSVSFFMIPLYIWGLVRFGVPFVVFPLAIAGASSGLLFRALTNQSNKAPASQAGTH